MKNISTNVILVYSVMLKKKQYFIYFAIVVMSDTSEVEYLFESVCDGK